MRSSDVAHTPVKSVLGLYTFSGQAAAKLWESRGEISRLSPPSQIRPAQPVGNQWVFSAVQPQLLHTPIHKIFSPLTAVGTRLFPAIHIPYNEESKVHKRTLGVR